MIMGIDRPLVIGQRYTATAVHADPPYEIPYLVLREATYEEWVEGVKSDDPRPPTDKTIEEQIQTATKDHWFYKISVD